MTFEEVQVFFALIILFLRLALSIRTTAKGTGAFFGIQESSVLIALLNISVLNTVVIPTGTGAFRELKIVFANYST